MLWLLCPQPTLIPVLFFFANSLEANHTRANENTPMGTFFSHLACFQEEQLGGSRAPTLLCMGLSQNLVQGLVHGELALSRVLFATSETRRCLHWRGSIRFCLQFAALLRLLSDAGNAKAFTSQTLEFEPAHRDPFPK